MLKIELSCNSTATVIYSSEKRKRATYDNLYDNEETKSAVMMQAKHVQANLAPKLPSFIKYMLPSHVSGGFWLVNLFLSIIWFFQ